MILGVIDLAAITAHRKTTRPIPPAHLALACSYKFRMPNCLRNLGLCICLTVAGCASGYFPPIAPAAAPAQPNPVTINLRNRELAFNALVDVTDDYFNIRREERVRLAGDVLTEGRIETEPVIGASVLEPWRGDSVSSRSRWESTLQTIRRRAIIRVIPVEVGLQVEVMVLKELEDVRKPISATASDATFPRYDTSLERFQSTIGEFPIEAGWIPQGRDFELEQRIIMQLRKELGV